MKTKYFILAAVAGMTLASCSSDEFVGDLSPSTSQVTNDTEAINFGLNLQNTTRGEIVGADAAKKLGGMFVVEGTKGDEQTASPSTTVVFDNYLVGYEANTAGKTESNTHNWEYVGKQTGITDRMTATTWNSLHPAGSAQSQTIKYWDYSVSQYDFIAWSTGTCTAVPVPAPAALPTAGTVQVTRINTGSTLSSTGFTMTAANANDLMQCYYTDITTVTKASGNYGQPVTLTFRNMAAKVRVALYETVPGYSVKDVQFYTSDATDPTEPDDLANLALPADPADPTKGIVATLFTTGSGVVLPQSGAVTVKYPRIGTTYRDAASKPVDYNKASVSVSPVSGGATSTTQAFGTLYNYQGAESNEETGTKYLGRDITHATYAGIIGDNYYTAVIPNTDGHPLTLRVNYTLVPIDGAAETITVYGAKAVVPSTYTNWLPNYAYTYIFKISDNTNGWTSTDAENDPDGLFPITFDAVVTSFIDAYAEQTTVTTVATPSITTYQQGHNHKNKNEYSKSQTAGVSPAVKDVYVQVMKTDGSASPLVTGLSSTNSLLYKVSKANASEAEVMDALQNRTNSYADNNPAGRNNITLTKDASNISNTVESIVNGVDDQPIAVTSGTTAMINIDALETGTYAYVYASTVPTSEEKIYHVAAGVTDASTAANYYEVTISDIATTACAADAEAEAGKVYFVMNVVAQGNLVSYTFKQTKAGDDVEGLFAADIPTDKGTTSYSENHFYFDVYNKNNGEYAVKVIKVVE